MPVDLHCKVSLQESRRRYRERVKNKAIETQAAYDKAVEEIARLRHEQTRLQNENMVLENMCRYSEAAVNLIRNAASSISTIAVDSAWQLKAAAQSSMMGTYEEVVDTVWTKLLRPTDDQLRTMVQHGNFIPSVQSKYLDRLGNAIFEWQKSSPAGRELIERKLSYAFDTRARFGKIMLEEYPQFTRDIFTIANGLRMESQRHSVILQRNKLFDNEDLSFSINLVFFCICSSAQ